MTEGVHSISLSVGVGEYNIENSLFIVIDGGDGELLF